MKDTSVVGIGGRSLAVIQDVHVTKNDDHVSHRHDRLGTEMLRQNTHDRNLAINKYIRDFQKLTTAQNDTLHCAKALKKAVAQTGRGANYKKTKTWHPQLEDKQNRLPPMHTG